MVSYFTARDGSYPRAFLQGLRHLFACARWISRISSSRAAQMHPKWSQELPRQSGARTRQIKR